MDLCEPPLQNRIPKEEPMGRHRKPNKTAREKLLAVIAWAHGAGFNNIAVELHDVLALLPADKSGGTHGRH